MNSSTRFLRFWRNTSFFVVLTPYINAADHHFSFISLVCQEASLRRRHLMLKFAFATCKIDTFADIIIKELQICFGSKTFKPLVVCRITLSGFKGFEQVSVTAVEHSDFLHNFFLWNYRDRRFDPNMLDVLRFSFCFCENCRLWSTLSHFHLFSNLQKGSHRTRLCWQLDLFGSGRIAGNRTALGLSCSFRVGLNCVVVLCCLVLCCRVGLCCAVSLPFIVTIVAFG